MLGELVLFHPLLVPIFFTVAGFALAFRGRKLVPLALGLAALVIGYLYGSSALAALGVSPDVLKWGPPVIAVFFLVVAMFLYRVAFFLAGALLGFFAAKIFFPFSPVLILIAVTVFTGALVYFFRNFVFSVLTALLGASLAASGTVNLLAWAGIAAGTAAYWGIALFAASFGLANQLRTERKRV